MSMMNLLIPSVKNGQKWLSDNKVQRSDHWITDKRENVRASVIEYIPCASFFQIREMKSFYRWQDVDSPDIMADKLSEKSL